MMGKCIFCQPEEEAKEVGDADICDECAERGLKEGWLKDPDAKLNLEEK